MFFQSLKQLLDSNPSVTVSLTAGHDDQVTVIVAVPPSDKDKAPADSALLHPMRLVGTAQELDAEFANAIGAFDGSRKALAEQIAETQAVMDKAAKSSQAKAVKAVSKQKDTSESKGLDDLEPDASPQATTKTETDAKPDSELASASEKPKAEPDTGKAKGGFDLGELL